MALIVENGKSLEGRSVHGNSRIPLSYKGLVRYKNKNCHRYKVEFNVNANINDKLNKADEKIDENASICLDDEIKCDAALIHTIKSKYRQEVKKGISGTHGSNVWKYPQQTNVKVTKPHHEIINAIWKKSKSIK